MKPILSLKAGIRLVPAALLAISAAAAAQPTTVIVQEKDKRERSYSFLRPSFGGIFYEDRGEDFERFAVGFLLELNLTSNDELVAGPVVGLVYSSIDDEGTARLDDNDFIMQIPAALKLAWVPGGVSKVKVGAHGGVNLIYSQAHAFGNPRDDDRFNTYANVGADFDFRVAKNLEIGVRPDWTFLEDFDLFTLTVGLGVAL